MLDEIAGTPVFNGERSRAGYRLNRMAMSLTDAANRAAFVADETGYARGMAAERRRDRHDRAARLEGDDRGRRQHLSADQDRRRARCAACTQVGAQTAGMTLEQFMAKRKGR